MTHTLLKWHSSKPALLVFHEDTIERAFTFPQVSAFIVCLITLDRLIVVRFPFSLRRFTASHAHLASVLAWTAGLAMAGDNICAASAGAVAPATFLNTITMTTCNFYFSYYYYYHSFFFLFFCYCW